MFVSDPRKRLIASHDGQGLQRYHADLNDPCRRFSGEETLGDLASGQKLASAEAGKVLSPSG